MISRSVDTISRLQLFQYRSFESRAHAQKGHMNEIGVRRNNSKKTD